LRVYDAKYFYVNVSGTNGYHCAWNGQKILHSSEILAAQ
jgi:hypothetical protein